MHKCIVCNKDFNREDGVFVSNIDFACGSCAKSHYPPLLILLLFDTRNVGERYWNPLLFKDEAVQRIQMFDGCGWFLRAITTSGFKAVLYYEFYGNAKCYRINEQMQKFYTGFECKMALCEKMKHNKNIDPETALAWQQRPLFYRERKKLICY